MNAKERIEAILEHYDITAAKLAQRIGARTTQSIYDILHGQTKTITSTMEKKILSCFSDINRTWLLTGEGEMIKPTVQQLANGDNDIQINGSNNKVNLSSTLDKAINEISEQRKLVSKAQEQIDRLLSLLEQK